MQSLNDFTCTDCEDNFNSASELLKHFAEHVSNDSIHSIFENSGKTNKKGSIPDLYPIDIFKRLQCNFQLSKPKENSTVRNGLNPLRFCEVTMEESYNENDCERDDNYQRDIDKGKLKNRAYLKCKTCDFKCETRCILKKHENRHKVERITTISPVKLKSRKQEKCNIKRRKMYSKLLQESTTNGLLCST